MWNSTKQHSESIHGGSEKLYGILQHLQQSIQRILLVQDSLTYEKPTYQIIDPITLDRYMRAVSYELEKLSLNYEAVFRHTYSYYS